MSQSYIHDGAIIRYKKKIETKWNYEICTEDDLDNYHNCQSDYGHTPTGIKIFAETDWEVVFNGEINISEDMVKSLQDDCQPLENTEEIREWCKYCGSYSCYCDQIR